MADYKAYLKSSDMTEDMQQDAVESAVQALQSQSAHKEVAGYIKKEFDRKYGPTWHCIVGKHFGSFVTHEGHHFTYFFLNDTAVLLFKSA